MSALSVFFKILLGAFTLLVSSTCLFSEEAEVWADGTGNMVLEAENLPESISEEQIVWQVDSNTKHQYPKPEAVGDVVLIMGDGNGNPDPFWGRAVPKGGSVTCRDLQTGDQIWRLVVPGKGYGPATYGVCGSPVILGDRIYIVALYDVYCLDLNGLNDGNQGAQNELELMMRAGYALPEGETEPTELPAWAADVIWHFDMKPLKIDVQDATSCTPVAVDGRLWVSTAHQLGYEASGRRVWEENEEGKKVRTEKLQPKTYAPHLIVLDLETGRHIAQDRMQVPIVFHGEWSSPALLEVNGEKAVIFPDGYGVLHGFALPTASEDGEPVWLEELWEFDLNPHEYRFDEEGRRHPYSYDIRQFDYKYPHDWPDGEDWEPIPEKKLYTLSIPGGPSEVIAVPTVVENRVYVGIGRDHNYDYGEIPEDRGVRVPRGRKFGLGRFLCLEFDDVKKAPRVLWEDRDVARMQASASVVDGLAFVVDNAGFLNCWDALTGEVFYKADVGTKMHERSQVVADGKIYFGDDRGILQIWKAGREPAQLDAGYRLGAHPATVEAIDGGLIIATGKDVTAFRTAGAEFAGQP